MRFQDQSEFNVTLIPPGNKVLQLHSCAFASKKTPHTVTGFSDKSAATWQAALLLSLECYFH